MEARGGPRKAFVGGGSYQWGPKIIQEVALNEELRGGNEKERKRLELRVATVDVRR